MVQKQVEIVRHQLYRCRGQEVVLQREGEVERNEEGRPKRTKSWFVQAASRDANGEIRLGESFEVQAGEIQFIGRTVETREAA